MLPDQLMESGIGRGSICQAHLTGNGQIKRLGGSYTLHEALESYKRLIHYHCKEGCTGRSHVTKHHCNALHCDSVLETVNL